MQWHQLDYMQTICTSLQTDNHINTSSLNFYWLDALSDAQPTVSRHRMHTTTSANKILFIFDRHVFSMINQLSLKNFPMLLQSQTPRTKQQTKQRTFEAMTRLRLPMGHGTITQSSAKLSGTSSIHSDNISCAWQTYRPCHQKLKLNTYQPIQVIWHEAALPPCTDHSITFTNVHPHLIHGSFGPHEYAPNCFQIGSAIFAEPTMWPTDTDTQTTDSHGMCDIAIGHINVVVLRP